jgi:Domain of unknown function (DUF4150)/GHH signature containing HNH/Endo VII superfamily nuclease toxin  2
MANQVYANGMEIACKSASGKTVAAMPDVCLSPPSPPAGPIPIPYPNTAFASDTIDGSKTVQISGQEIVLKDKSTFKKSTGDEAATKSLGMGVVSHQIQGKVNFTSWSMDVKIEGENAARHLDLTLHNEMSMPANTPTWPYMDEMAWSLDHPCIDNIKKTEAACSKLEVRSNGRLSIGKTKKKQCKDKDCRKEQKCMLRPWRPNRCCPGEQGHHLVEVHSFSPAGGRKAGELLTKFKGAYDEKKAPVVCASGPRNKKEHGALHAVQQQLEAAYHSKDGQWTYKQAREAGGLAHSLVYPHCDPECIQRQLDGYHTQAKPDGPGVNDDTSLRTDPGAGTRSAGTLGEDEQALVDQAVADAKGIGINATS